jgi:hypothetical protein
LEFIGNIKNQYTIQIKNKDYLVRRKQVLNHVKLLIEKFELSKQIYYLSVYLIDILLSQYEGFDYKLITMGCVLLSSKYKLILAKFIGKVKIPKCQDISQFIKNEYNMTELKQAEVDCLKLLDYKLTHSSALLYLDFFLNIGVIWDYEAFNGDLKEFNNQCYKVLDFFIQDIRYIDFNPLQISCAVISLVRDHYELKEPWSTLFAKIFNIKMNEFMNCFVVIKR